MANSYTKIMPQDGLPCTLDEAEEISTMLASAQEDDDRYHGFEFTFHGGVGYLEASTDGTVDELPEPVLKKIGELITAAGKSYWEFGVAMTCSAMRAGEFGGTAFRIMPDGKIVNRVETWSDGQEVLQLLRWAYNRVPAERLHQKKFLDVDEAAGSTYELTELPESEEIRKLLSIDHPRWP